MTLSGIWDSYFYDASHTIIELLSVYPYDTSLHVCHSTFCITFCTFGETQTHILWSVATGSVLLNYEGMLCVWWVTIPRPPLSQNGTLPTELHTPCSTDKGYRTQWHPGYEPGPETSPIGICGRHWNRTKYPYGYISLSRRTLSPSRFIFLCVHDGLRSHYLLRIRQTLYQLSYVNLLRTRKGTILQPIG